MLMGSTYQRLGFAGLGRIAFLGDDTCSSTAKTNEASNAARTAAYAGGQIPAQVLRDQYNVTPLGLFKDNDGTAIDPASLIAKSIEAEANGGCYPWTYQGSYNPDQVHGWWCFTPPVPAGDTNVYDPAVYTGNTINTVCHVNPVFAPKYPNSDFYNHKVLTPYTYTPEYMNGLRTATQTIYDMATGRINVVNPVLPAQLDPYGLGTGTGAASAGGANMAAGSTPSDYINQQQALPLSQRDPLLVPILVKYGYTELQAQQIGNAPQHPLGTDTMGRPLIDPNTGLPMVVGGGGGAPVSTPTPIQQVPINYPPPTPYTAAPIAQYTPQTTIPAAAPMSLTTYEPDATQPLPVITAGVSPNTPAYRMLVNSGSNSSMPASSVGPIGSSVAVQQPTNGSAIAPAATTGFDVAGIESWIQQNSLLAVGIAAALMFFMGKGE